jgi:hypothetical protein
VELSPVLARLTDDERAEALRELGVRRTEQDASAVEHALRFAEDRAEDREARALFVATCLAVEKETLEELRGRVARVALRLREARERAEAAARPTSGRDAVVVIGATEGLDLDSTQPASPNAIRVVLPFSPPSADAAPPRFTPSDRSDLAGDTAPLPGAGTTESEHLRMLQLQPYAELTAALRREPNRRAEILRAASFPDEASFLQIARVWATRFLESPALQQRFETAVERVLRGGRSS